MTLQPHWSGRVLSAPEHRIGGLKIIFVSHAQNYEDVALFRALGDIERGFYIDIGAFHADRYSVTKAFYDRGWSGINIEPNPGLHKEIVLARPRDVNLCVAVADAPGTIELTIFEDDALSTTSSETVTYHRTNHHVVEIVPVQAVLLESVWDDHVPSDSEVHFLKLDIEGGEREVIRSFDWSRRRPWVVVVEATKPETEVDSSWEWESTLLNAGYLLAYNDRLNRFYVSSEHSSLVSQLSLPPSVHDQFISGEVSELRSRLHEMAGLQEALASAQLSARESDELYRAIIKSTSWRATRPLRALSRLIRGRSSGAPPANL